MWNSIRKMMIVILSSCLTVSCTTTIKIKTNVPDAAIYVKGQYMGTGEVTTSISTKEWAMVSAEKDGYLPARYVYSSDGGESAMNYTMAVLCGATLFLFFPACILAFTPNLQGNRNLELKLIPDKPVSYENINE